MCYNFRQPPALTQLVLLYVNRNYHIWKDSDLLPWLERNVNMVLDRVDKKEVNVEDYDSKKTRRYQGPLPINISRHILLSEVKGVSPMTDVSHAMFKIFS